MTILISQMPWPVDWRFCLSHGPPAIFLDRFGGYEFAALVLCLGLGPHFQGSTTFGGGRQDGDQAVSEPAQAPNWSPRSRRRRRRSNPAVRAKSRASDSAVRCNSARSPAVAFSRPRSALAVSRCSSAGD